MVGLAIGISIFVLIWIWVIYELYKTPLVDKKGRIVKKETKTDNLLDFDEDEEFLG